MSTWRQKLACVLIRWRNSLRGFRLVPVVDFNREFNSDDGKVAIAEEFFHLERGGVYYTAAVENLLWRAGQLVRNEFGSQ